MAGPNHPNAKKAPKRGAPADPGANPESRRGSARRPGRPFKDGEKAARVLGEAIAELGRLHPTIIRRAITIALQIMSERNGKR